MVRVHAGRVIAAVANVQSIRNITVMQRVRNTVNYLLFFANTKPDGSISVGADSSLPQPAAFGLTHVLPETLFQWTLRVVRVKALRTAIPAFAGFQSAWLAVRKLRPAGKTEPVSGGNINSRH